MAALAGMMAYGQAMADDRRAHPRDDIVSRIVTAEVDGERLSDTEFQMFWLLLVVAGNETTRNAVSGSVLALHEHGLWRGSPTTPSTCRPRVEELLRYVSPVQQFRRTATTRHGARRPAGAGRRQGGDLVRCGQPRPRGVHRAARPRPAPQPEPARRLRGQARTSVSAPTSPGSRWPRCCARLLGARAGSDHRRAHARRLPTSSTGSRTSRPGWARVRSEVPDDPTEWCSGRPATSAGSRCRRSWPTRTSSWSGCYAWSPDKVGHATSASCAASARSASPRPTTSTRCSRWSRTASSTTRCGSTSTRWCASSRPGVNIVSTAAFITGHSLGDGRRRIAEAVRAGRRLGVRHRASTPGSPTSSPSVGRGVCDRIDKITVTETADSTGYDSPATEIPVGFGRPIDDPDLQAMTADGTAVFEDAVRLLGDALGVEFDEVVCEAEYAADHRGPRPRLVADRGGVRGRHRRQLARPRGRPHGRRAAGAVAEGPDASIPTGRSTSGYLIEIDGPPDDPHQDRHPPAARLPGDDVRGLHGARHDPHGDAGDQRHPRASSPRRPASSPTPTSHSPSRVGSSRVGLSRRVDTARAGATA